MVGMLLPEQGLRPGSANVSVFDNDNSLVAKQYFAGKSSELIPSILSWVDEINGILSRVEISDASLTDEIDFQSNKGVNRPGELTIVNSELNHVSFRLHSVNLTLRHVEGTHIRIATNFHGPIPTAIALEDQCTVEHLDVDASVPVSIKVEGSEVHSFSLQKNSGNHDRWSSVSLYNSTIGPNVLIELEELVTLRMSECRVIGSFEVKQQQPLRVDVQRVKFEDAMAVSFARNTFCEGSTFRECVFMGAPNFEGCTFPADIEFTALKNFRDPSEHLGIFTALWSLLKSKWSKRSAPDARQESGHKQQASIAAGRYRALSKSLGELGARKQEAIFFTLEMRWMRRTGQLDQVEVALSWLYDFISRYGCSVKRPFFATALSAIFAFGIYLLCGVIDSRPIEWSVSVLQAARLAISTALLPFSGVKIAEDWIRSEPTLAPYSEFIRCVVLLHTFLSIVLLSLFAVGLRFMFRKRA